MRACVGFLVVGLLLCATSTALRTAPLLRPLGAVKLLDDDMPSVNVTFGVGASLFNKIFADVVPIFDLLNVNFPVPGINETHFEFNTFNLSDIQLAALTTAFSSPSTLTLSLQGLSLTIPSVDFLVRDTLLGIPISCQGSFWGNASQTNIALAIDLVTTSDGTLSVQSVTPTVSFGSLFVNHTIDGSFCQSLIGVIRDFLGSLNKLIEKLIKKDLPSKLADAIQQAANKDLPKIPFKFVAQPDVVNDTLALEADLGPLIPKGVSTRRSGHSKRLRTDIFTNRDLSITLGHNSLDNLLAIEIGTGKLALNDTLPAWVNTSLLRPLFPIIYRRCPACPLSFDVFVTQPPVTSMDRGYLSLNFTNLVVGINAYNATANSYGDRIFNLGFNITLEVYDMYINDLNSKLYLHIAIPTFAFDVYESSVGPVNVAQLSDIVNYLIVDVLVPVFNMAFPGVDVQLIKDGVGLKHVDFEFQSEALTIGADLALPKL